jgi:cysteinyl-tRNA synthetase
MKMDGKRTEHESFGMISINRIQGSNRNLFGSAIKHGNTIEIKSNHAECERHLNREWYYPRWEIISVEMSPTQFTDALTQMNTAGVPCTIRHKEGERMEEPPFDNVRDTFNAEFKDKLNDLMSTSGNAIKSLQEILKQKTVRKKDIKEVLASMEKINRDMFANLPYIDECFHEQMEKSITEAKGEIEGFFESRIRALGSEKLVEELEKGMLTNPTMIEE